MITAILGILNGFLDGISKFFNWLSEESLRESGRNEVRLEQAKETIKELQVAQTIDASPVPTDKRTILNGM